MDMLVSLLTTTEGRIGRKQWWTGAVAMIVVALVLSILLVAVTGANPTAVAWGGLVITLLMAWPSYALGIKRRHDRDSDGLDLKIMIGISILLGLIQALGIGFTMTDIGGGAMMPVPATWLSILNLAYAVYAIYMLVQLGFLRGTLGSNRFGADPLGQPALA